MRSLIDRFAAWLASLVRQRRLMRRYEAVIGIAKKMKEYGYAPDPLWMIERRIYGNVEVFNENDRM